MLDCRHCGEKLDENDPSLGARCPYCREPLHERPDALRRQRERRNRAGASAPFTPATFRSGPVSGAGPSCAAFAGHAGVIGSCAWPASSE